VGRGGDGPADLVDDLLVEGAAAAGLDADLKHVGPSVILY
jgi:hypothetical protein